MRYHDYHLRGYRVLDGGRRIVLDLLYSYPGLPTAESQIEFSGVAIYNFVHTAGATITGIDEVPLEQLFREVGEKISTWQRELGIDGWTGEVVDFRRSLEASGHRGWWIGSAIGFRGFVVARQVMQVD